MNLSASKICLTFNFLFEVCMQYKNSQSLISKLDESKILEMVFTIGELVNFKQSWVMQNGKISHLSLIKQKLHVRMLNI